MRHLRAPIASLLAAVVAVAGGCTIASPTAAGDQRVVVDVWLADYEFPNFLDPIRAQVAKFNAKHADVQINLTAIADYFNMPKLVAAAEAEGKAPDVVQYYYTDAQQALDQTGKNGAPLFTSVEKAIGGRKEILGEPVVLDDIIPAVRDYYTYNNGDSFGYPKNGSTAVLYSNLTVLEAAGVAEPPDTWAEIDAACAAIKKLPTGPRCITWANHGWFFQQAVASQGGFLTDNENGRAGRSRVVDLASKQMMAFVNWWKGLNDRGDYIYTGLQQDFIGTSQAFLSQEVAFTLNSIVPADFFVGLSGEFGFKSNATRFPMNGEVPFVGNVVGGDALWLHSGLDPKAQDGALAFMQFLNSPENTAEASKVGGFLPITETAITQLTAQGYYDQKPYLRVAVDQLNDPRRYGPDATAGTLSAARGGLFGSFAKIEDEMTKAMEDVLVRGADPFGRFTQATADAQIVLNTYNTSVQTGPPAQ